MSNALRDLLATRNFYKADLYTFTLFGGDILRYTDGDRDITFSGHTWAYGGPVGPYVNQDQQRSRFSWKPGLEVSTLTFGVSPGSATLGGTPFLTAVRQGAFDGAKLVVDRAFMPTFGNVAAGTVTPFLGRVSEVNISASLATFQAASHLELLNQQFPRNIYQAGCIWTLYDTGCTIDPAAFAVSGVVSDLLGSPAKFKATALTQSDNYFDLGKVVWTSGANVGVSRTVRNWTHSTGTVALISPTPGPIAVGDAFTIYPGCDKTRGTCTNRFSNLANFRGYPFIPQSETAI